MPMRLSGEEPRLEQGEAAHVTFTITDGHVVVPCRVGHAALQEAFGTPGGNAMAIFRAHRDAVVDGAIRRYERAGAEGGVVTLAGADLTP
ncbi:DUF1488 family protein [Methylobacterium radiodurans]|uniref:DUF1488 domain-containing protein n=1 Tax=Methylobacterium radiodurans TaxID=2202828 RepID=A0A2U8VM47_9HYPH|nr:DUF1488 family protein [Methylobacterium radiodurans]AWN34456.1 DUF1488 domain-containing protein [Methylobacterium radiodurans]